MSHLRIDADIRRFSLFALERLQRIALVFRKQVRIAFGADRLLIFFSVSEEIVDILSFCLRVCLLVSVSYINSLLTFLFNRDGSS